MSITIKMGEEKIVFPCENILSISLKGKIVSFIFKQWDARQESFAQYQAECATEAIAREMFKISQRELDNYYKK